MKYRFLITTLLVAAVLGGGVYLLAEKSYITLESFENLAGVDASTFAEVSTTSPSLISETVISEEVIIPILVYHIVRPSYLTDSASVRKLALTPESFDAEMKYLRDAGYHVIPFSDLETYLKEGKKLPAKPIVLTFDDGWSDQYTYAFPILKKYNYPTTFFVFTNAIGHRGFFTWDQLREMMVAGMTIGGHTRSHPYLTKIKTETMLWDEIYGSKQLLEQKLGVTVNEFAYPFGQYNASTTALVERAGYQSARGDYVTKGQESMRIFELGALNAPTTIEKFIQKFP